MDSLTLCILPQTFSVYQLPATAAIEWESFANHAVYSITRTPEELSIVAESGTLTTFRHEEPDWKALQVIGPLDFALTGILANIATILADRKISLFAISTFNTDYILVKAPDLPGAMSALRTSGHTVTTENI